MSYTVNEVAKLSGTTIKTLYHYQKLGLLLPESITDNGYRYYGDKELERLQQILFFRELDFPLDKIREALKNDDLRLERLEEQRLLLINRQKRMEEIINTIEETIKQAKKGEIMSTDKIFKGLNKNEWENTLQNQNEYLSKTYGYEIDAETIDLDDLNKKAKESKDFMEYMANALHNGVSFNDKKVHNAIKNHINSRGNVDAKGFLNEVKFLMDDEFHRQMLESHHIGLSYYIYCATESYATK